MSFRDAYRTIRPSIVAIAPKFSTAPADFPEIIGTGFFVSSHGVVCTCRHVVDAFADLTAPAGYADFKAVALLFVEVEEAGTRIWGCLSVDIHSVGHATLLPGRDRVPWTQSSGRLLPPAAPFKHTDDHVDRRSRGRR